MSLSTGLLLTVLLVMLNGLFVASEFSLISARRSQIEPRASGGSWAAAKTLGAMENISLVIAAAQLGITVCSLGLGAVGEPVFANLLEPAFEVAHMPDGLVHPVAFVIALSIVSYLHVLLGEMVPKNLSLAGPEQMALVLGPLMFGVVVVLRPVVWVLNAAAKGILQLLRVQTRDEVASAFTHAEVAGLVEESRREGLLDEEEYGLVSGALGFGAGTVENVLLPAASLVVVEPGSSPADIEAICAETGFSRFPVRNAAFDLVGYLHIKDVLEQARQRRLEAIADTWVRPLATVLRSTRLLDALRTMQQRGLHMAQVADEDGTVLGVVMLEDVLEELVGEVRDADRRDGDTA